jgi:uncharacterized protein YoxC
MTDKVEKAGNGTGKIIAYCVSVFIGTAVMATSVTFAITTAWLDNSKATMTEIKEDIKGVKTELKELNGKVDTKYDDVKASVTYHDKRLTRLEDRTKP